MPISTLYSLFFSFFEYSFIFSLCLFLSLIHIQMCIRDSRGTTQLGRLCVTYYPQYFTVVQANDAGLRHVMTQYFTMELANQADLASRIVPNILQQCKPIKHTLHHVLSTIFYSGLTNQAEHASRIVHNLFQQRKPMRQNLRRVLHTKIYQRAGQCGRPCVPYCTQYFTAVQANEADIASRILHSILLREQPITLRHLSYTIFYRSSSQ